MYMKIQSQPRNSSFLFNIFEGYLQYILVLRDYMRGHVYAHLCSTKRTYLRKERTLVKYTFLRSVTKFDLHPIYIVQASFRQYELRTIF